MRFPFPSLIAATLALPSAALAVPVGLDDLVTNGGVVAGGNALYFGFSYDLGDFDGITVEATETGNVVGLRFVTPRAVANRAEYFRGGGFSVTVFDPTKEIVETRLSIDADVDPTSFGPVVNVSTSLLTASKTKMTDAVFDSLDITQSLPFAETWSVAVTDSGSETGTGFGADLVSFEVQYVLGDRSDITAVPLPASAVLLIAGLGGLGVFRRRTGRSSS